MTVRDRRAHHAHDSVHTDGPAVVFVHPAPAPHRTAYPYCFLLPFGASDNDLPLEATWRTIEIDLRTVLGERDFPPPLLPVNHRPS